MAKMWTESAAESRGVVVRRTASHVRGAPSGVRYSILFERKRDKLFSVDVIKGVEGTERLGMNYGYDALYEVQPSGVGIFLTKFPGKHCM